MYYMGYFLGQEFYGKVTMGFYEIDHARLVLFEYLQSLLCSPSFCTPYGVLGAKRSQSRTES